MNAKLWEEKGKYIDIDGHSIFYLDVNPNSKHVVCILHGYPTSSFDYHKVLPLLKSYRVIIHDHLGFGFSDKPSSSQYLLSDQATLAYMLWEHLGVLNFHLVAHDYGTSVATELIARNNKGELNVNIQSLTLCNGSMLIDMAKLRFIQKLLKHPLTGNVVARFASQRTFTRNMRNTWYNPDLFDIDEAKEMWKMCLNNEGRKTLSTVTRYINQRFTYYNRWIGALKKTNLPTLILWAENDPVAVIEMAAVLNSYITNSEVRTLKETGHFSMLERPNEWSAALLKFLIAQNPTFY